ncbi:hypothetical protein BKP64_04770 [Marinobacter salinus]|uniref:Uncharacterized protein n=1 Tax=Marinobacter salinus TaxID=1874317 RepID=A0A1D9GIV0_9GAMM|nr:hypothetical protein BKP64_04770 [Marinobacter salinus]
MWAYLAFFLSAFLTCRFSLPVKFFDRPFFLSGIFHLVIWIPFLAVTKCYDFCRFVTEVCLIQEWREVAKLYVRHKTIKKAPDQPMAIVGFSLFGLEHAYAGSGISSGRR